jgi:hypothetical protein
MDIQMRLYKVAYMDHDIPEQKETAGCQDAILEISDCKIKT